MKKLLHIGVNVGTESMPKYFRQQCDYKEFRLDGNLKKNLQGLLKDNYTPDTIFLQIQSNKIHGKDTSAFIGEEIRRMKERGSFVINWTGDKRKGVPRWMIDFHSNVSVTGFSNEEDRIFASKYGMESIFLQQGIDTDIYSPVGGINYMPDIVFFANNYGRIFPLSGYRKEIVNSLKEQFGNRFGVYGNGWDDPRGNFNSSQSSESRGYRGCKIAISVSHFNADRYFSDRLGRALCSGSFVLSHNYKGVEKDFEVGKHFDVFDSTNQLIEKCNYWLANDRSVIAKNGMDLARKEFSYQNIIKQILTYE